jgi:hypothetical protein
MLSDLDEDWTRKLIKIKKKSFKSDDTPAEVHVEVAEVYSPPRMTKMVDMMGMKSGFALDLTANDENGKPWDFSIQEGRHAALKMQDDTKHEMLIASPPCTMFSALQNINMHKMTMENVKRRVDDAVTHFAFAVVMCMRQAPGGRLFMLQHPVAASSWTLRVASLLLRYPNARKVNFAFCMLGMAGRRRNGTDTKAHECDHQLDRCGGGIRKSTNAMEPTDMFG